MLEAAKHSESSFWTLTYANENLPEGGTLVPADLRNFLKRLRLVAHFERGVRLRHFSVGEYGDETFRPHYHLAIFGLGYGEADRLLVERAWKLGHVYGGDLTPQSAQYIAGYVTKKMTSHEDPRLLGRYPEFARMSLRPGIGASAMEDVAIALNTKHGAASVVQTGDVPLALRHGAKSLPLGRYLRRKLREQMGFSEPGQPDLARLRQHQKLQDVLRDAGSVSAYLEESASVDKVRVLQVETKAKIWAKKGKL